MQRFSTNVPGRRYHPRISGVVPAASRPASIPDADHAGVARAMVELYATNRAIRESLIHRGHDEIVDLTNFVENPNGASVPVLSFTVPGSTVLAITQIGLSYSEPMASMSRAVGWRIIINKNSPQYIDSLTYHWRYNSMGSINQPIDIDPLYVQSGETIVVEINTLSSGSLVAKQNWTEHLTVMARISGKLYKPASPALIGG